MKRKRLLENIAIAFIVIMFLLGSTATLAQIDSLYDNYLILAITLQVVLLILFLLSLAVFIEFIVNLISNEVIDNLNRQEIVDSSKPVIKDYLTTESELK